MQLSDPSALIDFEQLRPFMPIWIFPENGPEGDDHPPEVLDFYATANHLVDDMINRINDDITSRLYWYIISVLKGDPRNLCVEKTQDEDQKTPQRLLSLLNARYDKGDLTRSMTLQRELFSMQPSHGANIRRVLDDYLSKISKVRFDLSKLGHQFPDESIVSLVLTNLQRSKLLPTTVEMILQNQETDIERVFTLL